MGGLLNHNRLYVDKLTNSVVGKLTPIAAVFNAAEDQSGVRSDEIIDETATRLQLFSRNPLTPGNVLGEDRSSQAKGCLVCHPDGVDPEVIDDIRRVASQTEGVAEIGDVRVRWLGHRLNTEVNIGVSPNLSVEEGHKIADELYHELSRALPYLSNTTIHIYPRRGRPFIKYPGYT